MTEAIIYLAENRVCLENDFSRSNQIFQAPNTIKNLYRFDEDTLAAEKSMAYTLEMDAKILILPIVGAIEFENNLGNHTFVESGESLFFTLKKGDIYKISNPFEGETLVNFLQIAFKMDENIDTPLFCQTHFDMKQNEIVPISSSAGFKGYIGIFEGRADSTFQTENDLFVYAIQGAFEAQNRLLHPNDGLFLKNVGEFDWEALSNQAILLFFEI